MSNIHFLFNKTKDISRYSMRDSKQQWGDLIQRILHHQIDFSQMKYMIVEDERFDRISDQMIFCLPKRGLTSARMMRMVSIVQYTDLEHHRANVLLIPWINRNKSLGQKRVTIIPSEKRSTIDENYPTDDIRQLMNKTFSKYSNQDERISPSIRRLYSNAMVDIQQTQNLSRLSVLSISYGFGLGTKTWKNIREEKTISSQSISTLPANKIELDLDQQENFRRMSTVKKIS